MLILRERKHVSFVYKIQICLFLDLDEVEIKNTG